MFTWVPDPDVFASALIDVSEKLQDRTLPLMVASQTLRSDIIERFTTETDPAGRPWAPWSGFRYSDQYGSAQDRGTPGTAFGGSYHDYAIGYPNVGILRQDQDLFYDAVSEDRFRITSPQAAMVQSLYYNANDLPSAGMAHQKGAPNRKTHSGSPNPLPQREFIGMSLGASIAIGETFGEWFDDSTSIFINASGKAQRRWRGPAGGIRSSLGTFLPRG